MSKPGKQPDADQLMDLEFTAEAGRCDPRDAAALRVRLESVRGTARKLAPGERFVVCGTYRRKDPRIAKLALALGGRGRGVASPLLHEEGRFVVSIRAVRVAPGQEHSLDLVMQDNSGLELGVLKRLLLGRQVDN